MSIFRENLKLNVLLVVVLVLKSKALYWTDAREHGLIYLLYTMNSGKEKRLTWLVAYAAVWFVPAMAFLVQFSSHRHAFHIGFYLSSLLYLLTASSKRLRSVSLALSRTIAWTFWTLGEVSLLARTTTLKICFSWGIFNCLRTLYVSGSYFSYYVDKTKKRVYCNVIRLSWGNDQSRCAYHSLLCITSVKKVMLLSRAPN